MSGERASGRLRRMGVAPICALMLAACGSSHPTSGVDLPPLRDETLDAQLVDAIEQTRARGCDFLEPAYCLFPWPNDYFTVADAATDTGRRIDLPLAAMPKNLAGLPLRPDEWNRNDGFSPGQMMVTYVPGLDPEVSGIGNITDIEASLDADAPILVIDADTGERHPIWVEIDASETARTLCDAPASVFDIADLVAGELGIEDVVANLGAVVDGLGAGCTLTLQPILAALGEALHDTLLPNNALKVDPPALLMRPAKNFRDGHRYIVAMRNLKNAQGEIIEAPAAFRVYRDRYSSAFEEVNARRDHMEDIIARLARHGVRRDELYMAWDFTVASTRNLAGRLLHMRDTALASLGEAAPGFEITEVTDFETGETIRRVQGRYTVPNFLTLPDGICDNLLPPVSALVDYCARLETLGALLGGDELPLLGDLIGAASDAVGLLVELGQVPLSRLYYEGDSERPSINPLMPTQSFDFQCEIPRTALASFEDADTWLRPATPTLYGHGLLGGKGEVGGGSTRRLREQNFMHCAIDWIGMATRDVPSVLTYLLDMSFFPTLPDRVQQSIVNWHVLTRLIQHPDGLASHPAFQTADGRPVFDPAKVVYDGNSQGGIIGGAVMATSTDITRGVLGVPGANYSTLLRRSVDFDTYGALLYTSYPNSFDQSFILSFIQMLWDRAETNGYMNHLRRPDAYTALGHPTPNHEVLLHVAFGDHQVADLTPEVMSRSYDGAVHLPGTEPGRHTGVNPFALIRPAVDGEDGSVMVVWDIGPLNPDNPDNPGTAPSPAANTPPRQGRDPHSDPRADVAGGIQREAFLREDRYLDVCADRPCFTRGYLPADVASGAAGNAAPLVNALPEVQAKPGGRAAVTAIAADPDRDELAYQWQIVAGADCVAGIGDAGAASTELALAAACTRSEIVLRVTVSDGRGGTASEITRVRLVGADGSRQSPADG
ncbi:hypothetical protein [Sinimarinibacterium thermocellulolyticum]|uniref:Uncharacterized protein n=1 Tax=Sinimarinibacterium thermocellulolyticum TaxID=3170016 RepID=A0ABV2A7X6_9GAMM